MSASLNSPPDTARRDEVAPKCFHFGACGGCQLQNLSYESQLALKFQRVSSLLSPLGIELSDVIRSPDQWFYRNKMEFSFGDVYPPVEGGPTLKLGLKPRGKWFEILDLQECHLLSPETPALLAAVRRWAAENGV